jgi:antirestriction protein ArdC
MKPKDKVYDTVVTPLIYRLERIEAGESISPWHKPWVKDGTENMLNGLGSARNGVTKRQYNGINWLILGMMSDHTSRDYFTLNQLKELTGNSHPVPNEVFKDAYDVVFYKTLVGTDDKTGKDKRIPFMRTYKVWNRDQIPGLPEPTPDVVAPDFNPDDAIALPQDSAFTSDAERESTKAHEGIHATGAKRRLNRKAFREYSVENYAYEELVAELGAAMTCSYIGIPLEQLQHTQYIKSWLSSLKNDKNYIFKAAAEANKAFQYLTGDKYVNTANK